MPAACHASGRGAKWRALRQRDRGGPSAGRDRKLCGATRRRAAHSLFQVFRSFLFCRRKTRHPHPPPPHTAVHVAASSTSRAGARVETKRAPAFSWHQRTAAFPSWPAVQAFLRGPQESAVFAATPGQFTSLPSARRWAEQHFGHSSRHSAKACADGSGAEAFVRVTKTRQAHEAALAQHAQHKAELTQLRKHVADAGRLRCAVLG